MFMYIAYAHYFGAHISIHLPCWGVQGKCGFFLGCCSLVCTYTLMVLVELRSTSCSLGSQKSKRFRLEKGLENMQTSSQK